ncbi:MAG TPA: MFS transporter [Chloroflexia bacterium]|nr:MFS transporter [Chloroflexia bacterium]
MQANARLPLRVVLAYAAFVMIGAQDGALGVLLPSIQGAFSIDKSTVSILFLFGTAGYLMAAFSSGLLVERLGTRLFLTLGGCAFVLGSAGVWVALSFPVMLVSFLALAFGVGVIDAGLNTYVAGLPNNTGLLNYLHACYGLGALIGPIVASAFLALSIAWTAVYLLWAITSLVIALGLCLAFRGLGRVRHTQGDGKQGRNVLLSALDLRVVWLAAIFLLLYVGGEMSLGSWTYSLFTEERAFAPLIAGWTVSGFWMGLTLGRLLLGRVATRIGDHNLIQLCLAGTIVGLVMVWLSPFQPIAAIGLWLTGFSLGPIFPTAIAIMSRMVAPRVLPSAIGFAASAGSAGAAFFPWLAGNLAEGFGLWTLMPYVMAVSLLMLAVWWAFQSQPTLEAGPAKMEDAV